MATRCEDGVRKVKVCDKVGERLLLVKQNRRNPTLQLLKPAIKERDLAKFTWLTPMYFGQDHKNILIQHPGEEHRNKMVVLL